MTPLSNSQQIAKDLTTAIIISEGIPLKNNSTKDIPTIALSAVKLYQAIFAVLEEETKKAPQWAP